MEESLARQLDNLALQMGGFLRGFEDQHIHVGSAASFISEFRKVLEYPMIHQSCDKLPISYAVAVENYRVPPPDGIAADPAAIMIQGLAQPSVHAPDVRRKLPLDMRTMGNRPDLHPA